MKIVLSELTQKKIQHWVDKADFEVSGFGKVQYFKESDTFFVSDAYLVKQEGSSAFTDIDSAGLAQLMYKTKDIPGLLNFWWHSHVNMSVFWSDTDKSTIMELGAQGLCVATVFNKKREMRSAVCAKMTGVFGDKTLFWDEVPTTIDTAAVQVPEEWNKEFDDNVQRKKWDAPGTGAKGYLRENGNDSSDSWNKEAREAWEKDWEKDQYGFWQKKTPKTSQETTTKDTTTTLPKTLIPSWAFREAKLIDMTIFEYWRIIHGNDIDKVLEVEKKLESACLKKHGVTYDQWSMLHIKDRLEATEQKWNT